MTTERRRDASECDRLLQRTIHEENVFYARLNFFLVFETALLAAFVAVEQEHAVWPVVAWAVPILGIVISVLWWRAQARQYDHVAKLGRRVTTELPEYQGTYAGSTTAVSATWLMTHGLPLLLILIWIIVRVSLSAFQSTVSTASRQSPMSVGMPLIAHAFAMNEAEKNMWDVMLQAAQLIAVIIAAGWAYFRFRREGVHNPAIEFDVEVRVFGVEPGQYLLEIAAVAQNKGLVEHHFRSIAITVRGIRAGVAPHYQEGHAPRLDFGDEVRRFKNLVPPEDEYFFVRPAVTQRFPVTTFVSTDYRYLLVRAVFEYDPTGDTHEAERVLALSPAGAA